VVFESSRRLVGFMSTYAGASPTHDVVLMWGASHSGWPPKGLIGNSPCNIKTEEKLIKTKKTNETLRKSNNMHFKVGGRPVNFESVH